MSKQAEVGKVSEAGGALLREKGRRSGVHGATPESSVSSPPNDDSPTAVMQGSLRGPIQSHGKSGLASANVPVVDQSPASVQPGAVMAPAMPETPCAGCGRTRTEAEGGRIFTHCDTCWPTAPAPPDALKPIRDWAAQFNPASDARLTVRDAVALSAAILAALDQTIGDKP